MRSSATTKRFGQLPGHLFSFPKISLIAIKTWGMMTGISELHRHGLIRKPEKELWVTSLRDFALNRMMVVSDTVKMKGK